MLVEFFKNLTYVMHTCGQTSFKTVFAYLTHASRIMTNN
jgi:hypothetical protein